MVVTTDSIFKKDSTIFINGSVIDAGGGIENYGHCWSSVNPLPVISDDTSSHGPLNHSGSFQSALKNLKKGKAYYVRAYARRNNEITYGNTLHFTYDFSTVSIGPVFQLNSDSIMVNSIITTKELDKPLKFGFCWKEGNVIPTINDSCAIFRNTTTMPLYAAIRNFKEGTNYSIRSYAIYNSDTVYSDVKTITTGSRIFWNGLGSPYELQKSNPVIKTIAYHNANEATYLRAKFGDGLFINQDTTEGMGNGSANFFALDVSKIHLSAQCGTIEFWFIFKYNSTSTDKALFFDFANEFTDHFPYLSPDSSNTLTYLSGGWCGWPLSENQKYFFFTIGSTNTKLTITSKDIFKFRSGDTCHFAFAWDANGIGGSQDKMRIYRNGCVIASGSSPWNYSQPLDSVMYLGAKPGYGTRDERFNAVKGITDNLKIYNFAKVSYSDRGIEDKR
jgi:hypothetical protein